MTRYISKRETELTEKFINILGDEDSKLVHFKTAIKDILKNGYSGDDVDIALDIIDVYLRKDFEGTYTLFKECHEISFILRDHVMRFIETYIDDNAFHFYLMDRVHDDDKNKRLKEISYIYIRQTDNGMIIPRNLSIVVENKYIFNYDIYHDEHSQMYTFLTHDDIHPDEMEKIFKEISKIIEEEGGRPAAFTDIELKERNLLSHESGAGYKASYVIKFKRPGC